MYTYLSYVTIALVCVFDLQIVRWPDTIERRRQKKEKKKLHYTGAVFFQCPLN